MSVVGKLALFVVAVVATVLILRHGRTALEAQRPSDMPSDARFLASGYDLQSNEPRGNWIACRIDADEHANWCRVTDAQGAVVFQGRFLPIEGRAPVPASDLQIAPRNPSHLWVQGPTEAYPVPVIPLINGTLLVPADDQELLTARWSRSPEELNRLRAQ